MTLPPVFCNLPYVAGLYGDTQMAVNLPLKDMTKEEKLQAMEMLWADLCAKDTEVSPPAWHGEVLAEREAALGGDTRQFEDWATARQRIESDIK